MVHHVHISQNGRPMARPASGLPVARAGQPVARPARAGQPVARPASGQPVARAGEGPPT